MTPFLPVNDSPPSDVVPPLPQFLPSREGQQGSGQMRSEPWAVVVLSRRCETGFLHGLEVACQEMLANWEKSQRLDRTTAGWQLWWLE